MPTVRTRPKRSRDPIKAAYEVFQEIIGEKPRFQPTKKSRKTTASDPQKKAAPAPK